LNKKVKKSGKIEQKAKKRHVFVQKSAQNFTPDTNALFNVKIGKFLRSKIPFSK